MVKPIRQEYETPKSPRKFLYMLSTWYMAKCFSLFTGECGYIRCHLSHLFLCLASGLSPSFRMKILESPLTFFSLPHPFMELLRSVLSSFLTSHPTPTRWASARGRDTYSDQLRRARAPSLCVPGCWCRNTALPLLHQLSIFQRLGIASKTPVSWFYIRHSAIHHLTTLWP